MANFNIFIHGVPQGHDYDSAESTFFSSFYSEKYDTPELFDVQYRKSSNELYFTYLRAQNVIGFDNRKSDSTYCAITLKTDVYYRNVSALLMMLKSSFDVLLEKVIKFDGQNYKFIVPSFSNDETIKKSIEGFLEGFLTATGNVNITKIDSSFSAQGKCVLSFNDCSPENVYSRLKSCARLCISQTYPSLKEQNIENRIREQMNQDITRKDKEISEAEKRLEQKNKEFSELVSEKKNIELQLKQTQEKNNSISRELEDCKKRINDLKSKGDVSQYINQIKDPLAKLAKFLPNYYEDRHESHINRSDDNSNFSKKDVVNIVINGVTLLLAIVCSIFLIFFKGK